MESLTETGRDALDKKCRHVDRRADQRLLLARRHVPFVQANLIEVAGDDPAEIARWRGAMQAAGVWANDPVPLYPYPSSPDYRKLWGEPDDRAWERAHRPLSRPLRPFQRHSGGAAAAARGAGIRRRPMSLRLFMTTDAVGGVWRYCLTLAGELARSGVTVRLGVIGPRPTRDQRAEAAAVPGLSLERVDAPLDWVAGDAAALRAGMPRPR